MDNIKKLGYDVIYEDEKSIKYTNKLKDVDVLVCYNPFDTLDITKLSNLKWIQLSSIGIDQAPRDYLHKENIILTNNKGGYSIPMGEWIILMILQFLKNTKQMFEKQVNKKWKIDTSILELYGKNVGFIGTGSIAIEGAKRLQGFGVNVLGLNTSGKDVNYFDRCFPISKLSYLASICDFLVLTVPYTDKTHHIIDKKIFKAMKSSSYLINVSRGSIIKEDHLIEALKYGEIKGAALDVFENEPLDENNPLWKMDNVVISPHNSWISEMRNIRRFETIYENLKRFKKNEDLINVIDLNRGY